MGGVFAKNTSRETKKYGKQRYSLIVLDCELTYFVKHETKGKIQNFALWIPLIYLKRTWEIASSASAHHNIAEILLMLALNINQLISPLSLISWHLFKILHLKIIFYKTLWQNYCHYYLSHLNTLVFCVVFCIIVL